ncbi:MAG: hydrogenase maturation protease [Chloroflexi bacterium]|nr:hydrogenase maturation protease [Chloroflexota bacterium]
MKTIIIGLGNPILSDDGVGWKIAEALTPMVHRPPSTVVETASLGGLSLMERLEGYQRAILIDSMRTGLRPIGTVSLFPLNELPNAAESHSASAHDTSLMTALETGRRMGLALPDEVMVVAIEARTVHDFSEELSPEVADAVPRATQMVMELL